MEFMEVYQKGKRDRSENFSKTECSLLLKLALKRKAVIENRKTDSATNAVKSQAWTDLAVLFNAYSEGPTREAKGLKSKYEAMKKTMRKQVLSEARGKKRKREEEKLSAEEMELRELIVDHLQQNPQQMYQENSNGSSAGLTEEVDDWKHIETSLHEAQDEDMTDENESTQDDFKNIQRANHSEEEPGDPLSGDEGAELSFPTVDTEAVRETKKKSPPPRRRYKRRFRTSLPAVPKEDEKNGKITTLKLETAIIEREIAKTKLAEAKAKLRKAEIEEEIAMLNKRATLLSNCKRSIPNSASKQSTSGSVHQNEYGEVFTNL